MDIHLHDFYIYNGSRPVINLVCSKEAFDYPDISPAVMETGIRVSEFIRKYPRIKYTYDFRNNWDHFIVVEKEIYNYEYNYPVCIDGKGEPPSEYKDSDPRYKEDEIKSAELDNKKHQDIDIESINERLKSAFEWMTLKIEKELRKSLAEQINLKSILLTESNKEE
jgi:hypothetical protein